MTPAAVTTRLTPDDARDVTQLLMGFASLIDPDDPDGLANQVSGPELEALLLTPHQLAQLHPAARYRDGERAGVARELRRISATILGQLR